MSVGGLLPDVFFLTNLAKFVIFTLKLKILRIFKRKIDALKYIGEFLQKYYLNTRHEPDKYTPDGSRFLHFGTGS